jgi:hemerythrin
MYIQWNESLSVKIKELDDQHKKLFDMINNFYEGISTNKSSTAISQIVSEMKKYACLHFATEENIMSKYGYPNLPTHKKHHNDFIVKVQEYEEKINKGYPVLASDIVKFLKDWIIIHIQVEDKVYSNYFEKKGIIH